jgi:hypothetical protein
MTATAEIEKTKTETPSVASPPKATSQARAAAVVQAAYILQARTR